MGDSLATYRDRQRLAIERCLSRGLPLDWVARATGYKRSRIQYYLDHREQQWSAWQWTTDQQARFTYMVMAGAGPAAISRTLGIPYGKVYYRWQKLTGRR